MQFEHGKSIPVFVYLFGTLRWSLMMNSCRNLVLGSLSTDS